jgi:hypothetical protein
VAYFNYAKWHILIAPSTKMWVGYILVGKMKTSYKLHINGQQMRSYMLIVYITYVMCLHQGESSLATKHCIQLHLCN